MYKHSFLPAFQDNLLALPMDARKQAILSLSDIVKGLQQGQLLGSRQYTSDLSDCYKFYFDPQTNIKPRYRLIYRFINNGTTVQAVAVGLREGSEAYIIATKNLNR